MRVESATLVAFVAASAVAATAWSPLPLPLPFRLTCQFSSEAFAFSPHISSRLLGTGSTRRFLGSGGGGDGDGDHDHDDGNDGDYSSIRQHGVTSFDDLTPHPRVARAATTKTALTLTTKKGRAALSSSSSSSSSFGRKRGGRYGGGGGSGGGGGGQPNDARRKRGVGSRRAGSGNGAPYTTCPAEIAQAELFAALERARESMGRGTIVAADDDEKDKDDGGISVKKRSSYSSSSPLLLSGVPIDAMAFTSVINAWARSRSPHAPENAENILRIMSDFAEVMAKKDIHNNPNSDGGGDGDGNGNGNNKIRISVRPNVYAYNGVINAYARSGRGDDAAKNAERLMNEMIQLAPKQGGGGSNVRPDVVTYNSVMNAHASRSSREGAERAEELLNDLCNGREVGGSTGQGNVSGEPLRPDAISFGTVIKAWAGVKGKKAAEHAESILNSLERMYEESGRNERLKPNSIIYNSVIKAWANSGRRTGGAERAEAILERMERMSRPSEEGMEGDDMDVKPDAFTYALVISALTSGGVNDGADRAEALLHRMQESYERSCRAYNDDDKNNHNDALKPNAVVYNSVIHALAASGKPGSADRAEYWLDKMKDLYRRTKDMQVKPDVVTYNSVLDAIGKSGEYGSAERAEEMLRKMEDAYLSSSSSSSDDDDDVDVDDEIRIKPNVVTFNTVIHAWANAGGAGAGLRAESLLDQMEYMYDVTKDESIRPNAATYSSVIDAHAKSGTRKCGERAELVLNRMSERYHRSRFGTDRVVVVEEEDQFRGGVSAARPNPIVFSATINAWINSEKGLTPPKAEELLLRMMEADEEGRNAGNGDSDGASKSNNREEWAAMNKAFDLVVRELDRSSDEETVARIERMRQRHILRNLQL